MAAGWPSQKSGLRAFWFPSIWGENVDLRCPSFHSKKLSRPTSPGIPGSALGHVAVEPVTCKGNGNVLGVWGPLGFSGHFLPSLLTHLLYIFKTLKVGETSMFNYRWFKL